ncbi:inositol 1,4,5-trisphosphate-sensitive calcium-release channel [Aureococcus anophagefferens]|nr:inositol 1,4,5-trisphosphate-sensitive calcium-release channel [Aureococcus anophagefferens]
MRLRQLAAYYVGQVELLAELCRDRSYNAIAALEAEYTFGMCLWAVVNGGFGRLSGRRRRFDPAVTFPDADVGAVAFSADKFHLLKVFVAHYLDDGATQVMVADEPSRTLVTLKILNVVEALVDFGFYSNAADLRALLVPLFRVLDGGTDLRSRSAPPRRRRAPPPTFGLAAAGGRGAAPRGEACIVRVLGAVWDVLGHGRRRQAPPRARRKPASRPQRGAPDAARVAARFLGLFDGGGAVAGCDVVALCGVGDGEMDAALRFLSHHGATTCSARCWPSEAAPVPAGLAPRPRRAREPRRVWLRAGAAGDGQYARVVAILGAFGDLLSPSGGAALAARHQAIFLKIGLEKPLLACLLNDDVPAGDDAHSAASFGRLVDFRARLADVIGRFLVQHPAAQELMVPAIVDLHGPRGPAARAALVHAALLNLLAAGCGCHNVPNAVAVVAVVPWRQTLWGLLYGPDCVVARTSACSRRRTSAGEQHAHFLDLHDDVLWAVVLRVAALALPPAQRAPFRRARAALGRDGGADGLGAAFRTASGTLAAALDGWPAHLRAPARAPARRRRFAAAALEALRRFLSAREYRDARLRDLQLMIHPASARCFADALGRADAAGVRLGLSAFLCALFFGELALRVAAHAASAGGLRAGARVCFRAPIRYVDLACLVLEAITLARFVLGGDSGGHGVRGAAFRLVRGFKFLKFMKAALLPVRATNQRLYRSAQRAVVETRRARVLVDVLSLWPCDPRLRGAALRLCCAVLDDSNHATQAWFVASVARGEVLMVAAAELRGVAKALERHHRRAQAGVAPPLAAAPLADAVWTVRLLTRLLAGQNAPMQRCIRAQTGLTKAVNMLRELEDLLAVLAHPPPARTTALEKHLVCEVVDRAAKGAASQRAPRALLAARVDDRALAAALAECAARHVASPPPRCTPPYDFLADRDEVDVEHEIDHVVGDLIVALSSLRLRLRGVSAAEGPFRSLLAEVDVSWHGRVERVVFARPEFASSLTVAAQRRFEASVDLTSAETRMRELFSAGAAIMKEATYLHAIGRQSRWYGAVNDHYVSLKLPALLPRAPPEPPPGLDLALLYGAAVALYAAAFGWDEHLAALTAALAGAAAPAVLRRRWGARSNEQLVAITLYDAVTGDMGVGGNALFALVACAGFAWQYAWIFLLLDVLLISDDLQNLLKAVILPWRQLALALYSLLVFTAILSVVNFYLNAADDDGAVGGVHQLHAPAASATATTAPAGAALSPTDAMRRRANLSRVLVQLTFFILVTLLLINVFTGIILDTFSSLREELSGRKEKEKYECFVCGVDRTTLDDFGIDKEDHETHEHNKWDYLLYLDHVRSRASDVAPLTGVAAYVAACDAAGDHDWLPLDTSFRLEQLAKGDEKRTNVSHDLRPVYDTLLATQAAVARLRDDVAADVRAARGAAASSAAAPARAPPPPGSPR